MTIYYRFHSLLDVEAFFSSYLGLNNAFPSYIGDVAVQNLGSVYSTDGTCLVMASGKLHEFESYEYTPLRDENLPCFALTQEPSTCSI